jgi:RNA polymerase sigma-70 factor (ECF subfamily)
MDEQELISRSQSGDIQAFNDLVELYQRQVYNVALRMLGSAETAEDATQDTFVSAYRAIARFRGGSFKAWILRIAANSCRDKMRVSRRASIVSLDSLMEEVGDFIADDRAESPEDYAERRELGRLLDGSLAHLPEDQRLVVVLSDIQGLTYEEIAQVIGISLGTVKSRLSRARLRLRELLLQRRELLPDEFRQYS